MKIGIHPNYNPQAKIVCACGHSFTIGSTLDESHVELCSKCHPFFTGKQKLIDTARRVDKYQKRVEAKTTEPSRSKRLKLKEKSSKRQLKVDESKKERTSQRMSLRAE